MTLTQVKTIAKTLGIKPAKMKKVELIHSIQKTEGNFDCFGTADTFCDQTACMFRDDCLKPQKTH